MEKAYLQALSVIVGAELRYVAIVTTNARYFDTTSSSSSTTTNTTGTDTTSTQNQPPEIAIDLIKTELGRPYYLCVGKHSFCILDRNMSGNPADGGYLVKIPFRGIKKVNTCGSSKDAVSIDIHPNQAMVPNGCALPESIYIRSGSSERIVQQLRICWKADNMYRTLSVQDLQVEQLPNILHIVVDEMNLDEEELPDSWVSDGGGLGGDAPVQREGFSAQAPMPALKMFETRSYMFYAPKDFVQVGRKDSGHFVRAGGGSGNKKSSSSSSSSSSSESLVVREFKRVQFDSTEVANVYDKHSIKTVCEHYVRTEIAPTLQTFRHLERPKQIMKRGNTCGDPASWDAWMIVIRAGAAVNKVRAQHEDMGESEEGSEDPKDDTVYANRDICIVACRRSFIPPSMDTWQDLVVVYLCEQTTVGSSSRGMVASQAVFDTIVPKTRDFNYDRIVIQTKADALLLTDEEYSWFAYQQQIRPSGWNRGRQFCYALIKLLENANVISVTSNPVVQRAFHGVSVPSGHDDPFEYASLLEKEANGLPSDAPLRFIESWRRRVWRFFAWAVDGGVLPSVLTIESLVSNHGLLLGQPKTQMKITQLIDSLLYMHTPGKPFSKSNLLAKVQDDMLMRSFTFNDNIMCRLIETGYLRSALVVRGDQSVYPRFLVRLLQRSGRTKATRNSPRIQHCICKQLYNMSLRNSEQASKMSTRDLVSVTSNDDISINVVVPLLVRLLQHKDESVHVLAVASLVNYTLNNPIMKNLVMAGMAARTATSFLNSPNMDLVRHSCLLLYNCSKTEQYRQTIASYGAIQLLLDLLRPSPTPPIYRDVQVLTNAVAVLSNLAQDARLRGKVIGALGYEPDINAMRRQVNGGGDGGGGNTKKGNGDSKNGGTASSSSWVASRSEGCVPAVYLVLTDLLRKDVGIGMDDGGGAASTDITGEDGSGSGNMHGSMLHFRVVQTMKNLAVKIPSVSPAINEANKRSMRFCLPTVVSFLNVVGDRHMIHVVLEFVYVLCFDNILRRDLYNEYNLDLVMRDLATSDYSGLKKIIGDLRRLKSKLDE